jgi:hypothetical protein
MKYFVFDAEYRTDLEGHALYQAAERFDPEGIERTRDDDPRIKGRWVFKRPVCISWMILAEEDGQLRPAQFETIGMPEMDEAEMMRRFLEAVRGLPAHVPLVSWGGSASDEPQLRLAALRHGLTLPSRLAVPFRARARHGDNHVDLMTHMCGDAARVHLAEICAAYRIPAKVTAAPEAVGGLVARGKWSLVKSVCENDVLSTAGVLLHVAHSHASASSLFGALISLARFGAKRTHRPYAEAFECWANVLVRQETAFCLEELLGLTATHV